jgi:hypothetical protein
MAKTILFHIERVAVKRGGDVIQPDQFLLNLGLKLN